MRTLTSLSAILLCAALVPHEMKAQDSSVTVGDNGGHGTSGSGGKHGKDPQHIGVIHDHDHGIQVDSGGYYFVSEQGYQPACVQPMNTTPSSPVSLRTLDGKAADWTLRVRYGTLSLGTVTLQWQQAQPKISIQEHSRSWNHSGTVGGNPGAVSLQADSTIKSGKLSVNGRDYKYKPSTSGTVYFLIHYCPNGQCGNDGAGHPICP